MPTVEALLSAAARDASGVWVLGPVPPPPRAPPRPRAGAALSGLSGSTGRSGTAGAGVAGVAAPPRAPRPPPPRPAPPPPPAPRPPRPCGAAAVSVHAATNSSRRLSGDHSVRLILIASPAPLTFADVAV